MAREWLFDKVYGAVIGGAIGDSLGAPVEGWQYSEIREKYGRLTELIPNTQFNHYSEAGRITDDTTLRQYLSLAIVRKGGRVTVDDVAVVLKEKMNVNRFWLNEHIVMTKLKAGMNPFDIGRGCIPAGCAIMGISPIGIINAGNPAQAYQDGLCVASINQDLAERDCAATMAAGVAAAFIPEATVESIIEAMQNNCSFVVWRAMQFALKIARETGCVDGFIERFYETRLDWMAALPDGEFRIDRYFSPSALEILPASVGLFYLLNGDVNQCIIEGGSFGRDCDTIGGVVGALAGAYQGASAIRQDWIDLSEEANKSFFVELEGDERYNFRSMSERMVEAIDKERLAAQERADTLKVMLER